MMKWQQTGLVWGWITLVLVVLDQWTKLWALETLANRHIIEVMPHFDFRLAFNYGAAFSFLADAGGWQKWGLAIFAIIVSIFIVVWLARVKSSEKWLSIGLCLILSGAIGNTYDRLTYGYVVDFIDWYWERGVTHWPTFNIADTAISIGAFMLIVESLFMQPKAEQTKSE